MNLDYKRTKTYSLKYFFQYFFEFAQYHCSGAPDNMFFNFKGGCDTFFSVRSSHFCTYDDLIVQEIRQIILLIEPIESKKSHYFRNGLNLLYLKQNGLLYTKIKNVFYVIISILQWKRYIGFNKLFYIISPWGWIITEFNLQFTCINFKNITS